MIRPRVGSTPGQMCSHTLRLEWLFTVADFFLRSPNLTACNFAALWPTDPKFLALKDLNPFKTESKVQKTSSILRVGFALPKWPHFHRAYVVGDVYLISGLYHNSKLWYKKRSKINKYISICLEKSMEASMLAHVIYLVSIE